MTNGANTAPPKNADLPALASKLNSPIFISDAILPNEAQLVHHFQKWLQLSTLEDQLPERDIVHNASMSGLTAPEERLTDPVFPASAASFDPSSLNSQDVEWQRAQGPLYIPGMAHRSLQAGLIDSSWFLGALSAISTQTESLLDLIVSNNYASKGLYTFQFYKHGCWNQASARCQALAFGLSLIFKRPFQLSHAKRHQLSSLRSCKAVAAA